MGSGTGSMAVTVMPNVVACSWAWERSRAMTMTDTDSPLARLPCNWYFIPGLLSFLVK